MIVESTNYYAAPGKAAEVLEHRRRGSVLRRKMGLPAGRIFVKLEGAGPDVRWECEFEDQAAFKADLAARDKSPEFKLQREGMRDLLVKFERQVCELAAD